MAGLVADYGSESESEASNGSQSPKKINNTLLPRPNFATTSDEASKEKSVFINPFVEADNAKTAILEKHVKMISADVKSVNGKKICWNYRKNKCRFGHNCKYVHDSDLQIDKSTIIPSETKVKQVNLNLINLNNSVPSEELIAHKKKRPGMSQSIIPSNKVMKLYNEQKKN